MFFSVRSGKSHLLMTKLADERKRLLETQKVRRDTMWGTAHGHWYSTRFYLKPPSLAGFIDHAGRRTAGLD
jgi:hypothetical protein